MCQDKTLRSKIASILGDVLAENPIALTSYGNNEWLEAPVKDLDVASQRLRNDGFRFSYSFIDTRGERVRVYKKGEKTLRIYLV